MSRSKKYKFLRAPSIVSDHLDHLGTNNDIVIAESIEIQIWQNKYAPGGRYKL